MLGVLLGSRVSLASWAFRVLGEWDQYTSEGQGGTLDSTGSTFFGLDVSPLSLLYYLSELICEMNDYSRKKRLYVIVCFLPISGLF